MVQSSSLWEEILFKGNFSSARERSVMARLREFSEFLQAYFLAWTEFGISRSAISSSSYLVEVRASNKGQMVGGCVNTQGPGVVEGREWGVQKIFSNFAVVRA